MHAFKDQTVETDPPHMQQASISNAYTFMFADHFPKWPRLLIEVSSLDYWDRHRIEGYGHIDLSSVPGIQDHLFMFTIVNSLYSSYGVFVHVYACAHTMFNVSCISKAFGYTITLFVCCMPAN